MKRDIRDLTIKELEKEVLLMGQPAYRARQIFAALNIRNAGDFGDIAEIPSVLRERLREGFVISTLEPAGSQRSKDGTEKFLWRLSDGEHIETVFIKENRRATICLSTQVGCRFKCPFCASGTKGFVRDLNVTEIVRQILCMRDLTGYNLTNVVFMGMGEPLDNYDNLARSIKIINSPIGVGIGARKITVSTCGVVPGIIKLRSLHLQVELSVSLHAGNDNLRDRLVPVNRRYNLQSLISACEAYYRESKRVITLEYTLIKGVNDSPKDAREVAGIAGRIKAKVNLIACNPRTDPRNTGGVEADIGKFEKRLLARGVNVTIRRSKGSDIMAACGQLAGKSGREERGL